MQLAAFICRPSAVQRMLHGPGSSPRRVEAATISSSSLGRQLREPPLAPGPGRASSSSSGSRARAEEERPAPRCALWRARMPDGDGTHLTRMLTPGFLSLCLYL